MSGDAHSAPEPRDSAARGRSAVCRILVLQTIHANRLQEFQQVCARLRELAPESSLAVVVTPEIEGLVAALGSAQRLLLSARGGRMTLLRAIRAARFDKACIVSDGAGAPGQMRNDVLALAARPAELLWCVPGGEIRALSRMRLVLRVVGESVLAVLAAGVGAAVGVLVAAALLITGIASRLRRHGD